MVRIRSTRPILQVSLQSGPRNQRSLRSQQGPFAGLFAFLHTTIRGTTKQPFKHVCLGREGPILLARSELQDRSQVAAQHDRQFITIRHQLDPLDEGAQHLRCTPPCLLIAKLVVKGSDLLVVIFCKVGMLQGR